MEQQQRQLVVKALNKIHRDAVSVENPACPGTPDVNYIGGWVELKYAKDWPARDETTVRLDHFTPQQRVWLRRRWYNGIKSNATDGAVWLCLQVSKTRDWLVFDGESASKYVGKDGYNKAALLELAVFVGQSADEVAAYITGKDNVYSHRLSTEN
jgi:hypothetical protein